jgi:hypothetical protein
VESKEGHVHQVGQRRQQILRLKEGMTIERGVRELEHPSACPTYRTDSASEGTIGGKRIQNGDGRFERFHDSTVTSSGLSEVLGLFLEDIRDGLEGVALLKLLGEWVLCPWLSRLFRVLLQGRLEIGSKVRCQ